METKADIKALPQVLERIVTLLTPRSLREDLIGDLRRTYRSPRQSMKDAAGWLPRVLRGQLRRSFNIALVAGQACAMCVSFAGAPFSFGLAAGFALALGVLCVRDAHTFPVESPGEAALDAIVAVTFVVASQILMAGMMSFATVPAPIMRRGVAVSLVTLSLLRMTFRRPPKKTYGPREYAERAFRTVFAMDILWLIAWLFLMATNTDSAPSALDSVFGAIPIFIIGIDYRLRQERLSGPRQSDMPTSILHNKERAALMRKLSLLWIPNGIGAEILFFATIVLQFGAAIVVHVAVDWIRIGTNVAASLMLIVVWRYIRKANRRAGRLIEAEIQTLNSAEI